MRLPQGKNYQMEKNNITEMILEAGGYRRVEDTRI